MLDLGTLQAHIKLDGADKFNRGLEDAAQKTEEAGSAWQIAKGILASEFVKKGIELAIDGLKRLGDEFMKSVKLFASAEQLQGGIRKLFGEDAAKEVMDNANAAFSTVGISANDYMQNVTGFSASLLTSLGGDTQQAAKVADMAMRDIADNANTYGRYTVEELANVYQNLAKEQYTTLDNLSLGFAGSKEGMQALLDKAEELSGVHYELGNFADMAQAIHVVQEEMNITGTTANEAAGTIEGSFNATKAAYENLLTGLASPDADLDALVDNVFDSLGNLLENVAPVVDRIIRGLEKILPQVGAKIGPLLQRLQPYVNQALSSLGSLVVNGLGSVVADLWNQFGHLFIAGAALGIGLIINPVGAIVVALVSLLAAQLIQVLQENWPQIQQWFQDVPQNISNAVGGVAGLLLQKGKDILNGLLGGAKGVWGSVKSFFGNVPSNAKSALGNVTSTLQSKGSDLINGLRNGLSGAIGRVTSFVSSIPSRIVSALGNTSSLLWSAGANIVSGLISGLSSRIGGVIAKAKELGAAIKANKGPKAYDLKLLVENGQWIVDGLIDGIDSYIPNLEQKMRGVADTIADTAFTRPQLALAGTSGPYGTAGAGTNYNVYINGTKINSDSAIESKFMDLMTTMARRGMM